MKTLAGGRVQQDTRSQRRRLGEELLASDRRSRRSRRDRIERALTGLGVSQAYAARKDGLSTILGYHSVGDPHGGADPRMVHTIDEFRSQMAFLAEHRKVLSIDELVGRLAAGEPLPRRSVVITIDDGYADTATVAAPILAEFELPAVVYLATGIIDAGENMPTDRLYWAIANRTCHELPPDVVPSHLRVLTSDNDHEAYSAASLHITYLERDRRRALLSDITEALAPAEPAPRLMLDWDEIRQLAASPGITLGAHPHAHTDLRAFPDQVESEFGSTRRRIHEETGIDVDHVSFAYNRHSDDAPAAIAAMGFHSALSADVDRVVRAGTSPFELLRFDAPKETHLLKAWTTGAFPDFYRSARKRLNR